MNDIFETALAILIPVGCLVGLAMAWNLTEALFRLATLRHPSGSVAAVLTRLATATRARQPWAPALAGLAPLLPWPYPWRVARSCRLLHAGDDPGEVLANSPLLPRPLRAQARKALRLGPDAFITWCESSIEQTRTNVNAIGFLLPMVVTALGVGLLAWFVSVFIVPKYQWIYLNLGLTATPWLKAVLWSREHVSALVAGAVVFAIAAAIWLHARSWRAAARRQQAGLILAATQAGAPEAALPGASTGQDFAGICRDAGWTANDPEELARAVRMEDDRRRTRQAWLPAALAAIAPVLLGLPVAALAIAIFGTLIHLVESLGGQP